MNLFSINSQRNIPSLFISLVLTLSIIFTLFSPSVFAQSATTTIEGDTNTELNPTATSSSITTDDALSGGVIENDVNVQNIDSTETATTTGTTTASSTEPSGPGPIHLLASSSATTTNHATGTATTGSNHATGTIVDIETGNAVSYVDIVNVVNTNIVNSTGLIEFIKNVLGHSDFDLRDLFLSLFDYTNALSTVSCTEDVCGEGNLLIDLVNQATLENDITVMADTGSNTANGSSSAVTTGDAYASANIINLVNSNIIDSNYLLLVFDNYADTSGSLILPNSDFFTSLFGNGTGSGGDFAFTNTASTTNQVSTVADTGSNTASGTSTIDTGEAHASSYINNQINQNFLNTGSFSMLIRVQGTWSGEIFGLPPGMAWEQTPDGIRLFYAPDTETGSTNSMGTITNDASITNKVQVYALTGNNQVEGDGGSIETGNAHADATIFNIANTNVIGSNWMNLIFNIYGNWNGNLSFGQPDLWLGVRANTTSGTLRPGSPVTYTYTIFNRGDTAANQVYLENTFPTNSLRFEGGPTNQLASSTEKTRWELGTIAPGETRELVVASRISNDFGTRSRTPLPLAAEVRHNQPDGNDLDNEDSVLLYVGNPSRGSGGSRTIAANLFITKTADMNSAQPGDEVDYTIKLENRGGPLFDGVLVDTLTDEAGKIIVEQAWPIEKVENGEEILVTYTLQIPEDLPAGIYTNTAQVIGLHESKTARNQRLYESLTATHRLTVIAVDGMVLGAAATTCEPYLSSYLRMGLTNNPNEVVKLQRFLLDKVDNEQPVTGIFDRRTEQAVRQFQQQHADEILTPWGLQEPSGYVYYTTQKKVNEIMCGEAAEFPLTIAQQEEIALTRAIVNRPAPTQTVAAIIENSPATPPRVNEVEEEIANVVTMANTEPPEVSETPVTSRNPQLRDRLRSWLSPFWPF